jgi:DNA-binding transcriptional MerR regulator
MATSLRPFVDMKSRSDRPLLSIGEVAAQFGLAPHVLRHWESVGLLTPARAVAGRRRYALDQLYRIAIILQAKEVGFGLDDIRDIMTAPSPAMRTQVLHRHRAELARRVAQAHQCLPTGPQWRPHPSRLVVRRYGMHGRSNVRLAQASSLVPDDSATS